MKQRSLATLLATAILAGSVCFGVVTPATAGRERNWRIGTYLGSAATIAGLASGNGALALVGGGATLLSYSQWRREMRRRHRREDLRAYRAYRARWLRRHRGRRVVPVY